MERYAGEPWTTRSTLVAIRRAHFERAARSRGGGRPRRRPPFAPPRRLCRVPRRVPRAGGGRRARGGPGPGGGGGGGGEGGGGKGGGGGGVGDQHGRVHGAGRCAEMPSILERVLQQPIQHPQVNAPCAPPPAAPNPPNSRLRRISQLEVGLRRLPDPPGLVQPAGCCGQIIAAPGASRRQPAGAAIAAPYRSR